MLRYTVDSHGHLRFNFPKKTVKMFAIRVTQREYLHCFSFRILLKDSFQKKTTESPFIERLFFCFFLELQALTINTRLSMTKNCHSVYLDFSSVISLEEIAKNLPIKTMIMAFFYSFSQFFYPFLVKFYYP